MSNLNFTRGNMEWGEKVGTVSNEIEIWRGGRGEAVVLPVVINGGEGKTVSIVN